MFDLFKDTGINQDQYSWFASAFYLAYLVAEYPWSYLAQRTLMAKVICGCVITWGSILMITAATHNFGGMLACRFLLGVFESAITPLTIMIVGMWVSENPSDVLIWSMRSTDCWRVSTLATSSRFGRGSSSAAMASARCSAGS